MDILRCFVSRDRTRFVLAGLDVNVSDDFVQHPVALVATEHLPKGMNEDEAATTKQRKLAVNKTTVSFKNGLLTAVDLSLHVLNAIDSKLDGSQLTIHLG